MKKPGSYLVNGALASGAMCFAYSLSSSGRTAIDWTVLGLFALAILWNLFKLGQRLYRTGRANDLWHLLRTLLFWVVGLLDTAFSPPEDVGSWKYYLGWAFLVLAAADSVALFRKERASVRGSTEEEPA